MEGRAADIASTAYTVAFAYVGEGSATSGYDRWRAYSRSKLANLLFTAELHRRLQAAGTGTLAVAAHPGAAGTDLGSQGSGRSNRVLRTIYPALTQSVPSGALPMLRALTAPDVVGGE